MGPQRLADAPPDPERAAAFKSARIACGLNTIHWAIALGYQSDSEEADKRLRSQIYHMEDAQRPITAAVARLAEMFRRFGVPADFID